ncbi:MAG: tetratricopeptide repeat protein, partial [Candidatus Nitrosopelagicus sp.]|nr:tetratricopeptide repeat protein [Candidatus Nitrosopelagicus sp.]
MGIDYSTPDFNKFRKNMDEKSKEKFKKIQNIDTRINEIIKSMESSTDAIQIIEYCVEWKTLDDESPVPDVVKADAYRASKQNEKAKELFKNVIKEHPTYGWAYERYGYFLSNIEKFEEALECFDEVIRMDKNNVDALNGK